MKTSLWITNQGLLSQTPWRWLFHWHFSWTLNFDKTQSTKTQENQVNLSENYFSFKYNIMSLKFSVFSTLLVTATKRKFDNLERGRHKLFLETCAITHTQTHTHTHTRKLVYMCNLSHMQNHDIFTFCFIIKTWCTLCIERQFVWTVRPNV